VSVILLVKQSEGHGMARSNTENLQCVSATFHVSAAEVLEKGRINTVQLSNHMLAGRDTWLRWHRQFAQVLSPKLEQARLRS